ncbi:hypothetical protein RCZ04_00670 [Capnocytophaga sp. HP1101]
MRKIILLFGLLLSAGVASAQSFGAGDVQINGGLGVSGPGAMIYGSVDVGITDEITVGGELFYRGRNYNSVRYNNIGILATSNYHFNKLIRRLPSNVDLYGGLSLGYYNWSNDYKYDNWDPYYDSGLAVRLQTGGRYFFTENFGVNAELFVEHNSFATGGFKAGVTYRF